MVSTLAGWESTLFSLTREAAVYWASMKPELVPASGARNGGRPRENAGYSIRSTRRSLMLASSDRAMASMSAATASGSPAQLDHGPAAHLRREAHRLAAEVPGRHHPAVAGHDRVVHHRAQLDVDDPAGVGQDIPHRAVHLRRAAQAGRVLHGVAAGPVAGQQR